MKRTGHKAARLARAAQPTAAQAFKAQLAEFQQNMQDLGAKIRLKTDVAGERPSDWSYVGDMRQINELLRRALGTEK